ncbi:hypothetical protein MHK_009810 [Candidatus Magnetomorum sp. HK-1]|nr:hypothetical protein MHK_009810 [Candidatus Magnetomorum sp. HK-1]
MFALSPPGDALPCVSTNEILKYQIFLGWIIMNKFKNKYRIPSARAKGWDYSNNGAYFITICTSEKKILFGKINNNEMFLSDIGEIVKQEWIKSFEFRKELSCDAYVIMPNHIHAIVWILNIGKKTFQKQNQSYGVAYRFPKSIFSFVSGFKSAATRRIRTFRNTPKLTVWQTRFHDRIIRNEKEYTTIKQYIETNPILWENDKFYIVHS